MCTCILNLVYIDRLSTLEFKFPPTGGSTFQKQEQWNLIPLDGYVCISSVLFPSFVGTAKLMTDRPQFKD